MDHSKYRELRSLWYKKLREHGFKDIEQNDEDEHLYQWDSIRFKGADAVRRYTTKSEYYRRAGMFLHDYNFAKTEDKLIWEKHSSGISVRNIAKFMKKKGLRPCHKDTVHILIKKLTKVMLSRPTEGIDSEEEDDR